MKLTYLLLWLAGGGLVSLTTFFCVNLLKICVERHAAEDQRLWKILVSSNQE
jgi:hypothetical protein